MPIFTANEPTHLEKVIDSALSELEKHDPTSDEYNRIVDQLTSLHALLPEKQSGIKADALLNVFSNLAGIVSILAFEQYGHTITTKAVGFVSKLRM